MCLVSLSLSLIHIASLHVCILMIVVNLSPDFLDLLTPFVRIAVGVH